MHICVRMSCVSVCVCARVCVMDTDYIHTHTSVHHALSLIINRAFHIRSTRQLPIVSGVVDYTHNHLTTIIITLNYTVLSNKLKHVVRTISLLSNILQMFICVSYSLLCFMICYTNKTLTSQCVWTVSQHDAAMWSQW